MKTAWFALTLVCISFSVSAQESEQQIAFDSCRNAFLEVLFVFEDCITHEGHDQKQQCFDNFVKYCAYYAKNTMSKQSAFSFSGQAHEYAVLVNMHASRTENDRDMETYLQDSHRYTSRMQLVAFIESMCFEMIDE